MEEIRVRHEVFFHSLRKAPWQEQTDFIFYFDSLLAVEGMVACSTRSTLGISFASVALFSFLF